MHLAPDGQHNHASDMGIGEPLEACRTAPRDSAEQCKPGQQPDQLGLAIGQMAQAFAIFDENERLVVCNQAFRTLYRLDDAKATPGVYFWDILRHAGQNGLAPANNDELTLAEVKTLIANGSSWMGAREMSDGRVIFTVHEPLASGGWISMQSDVTEERAREEAEMARLREAEAQTMRFNAAINNMDQGFSMYGADRRLIVCNETFAKLYHLPERLTRPGTHFEEIYRHRFHIGMTPVGAEYDESLGNIEQLIVDARTAKTPMTFTSGQVIMVCHQPLEDGGWLSTHEDVTDHHRNAEIVRYLARHDSLTGLANRATFIEYMAEAEARIEAGETLAVICIDLDRFKEINDTYGHAVGDTVLTGISGRLLAMLEGRGLIARLGGDEFAALIGPLKSPTEALDIADELTELLQLPLEIGSSRITCGASCGVAIAPQHGRDAETLLRCADLALYRAKLESPRGYCLFESRMDVAQRRRQSIESGLKTAVETGSLNLAFQPLVSLSSGRVACCEALLRWQSPELGLVSPAEFIPVAEETGLIREIGVWALRNACLEAANWPCHVRVAVNVSAIQFRGDGLVEEVRHALAVSGLDPSRLELEITESLFLADDAHNLEVLHRLRELGVRFALDDFGTGYSSLAYMLRFPFDKVKIDRAIVSTIADKPETVAMVTAIVDLCKGFNMRTVAEGIETEKQLAEVKAHGCDEVQGYIFSPALPAAAIGEFLRRKPFPLAKPDDGIPERKSA